MLLVLGLGVGAALIRLLPWLLSPEVPLKVAFPFARALVGVALEAAVLVGVPSGMALGAVVFVERGEARALFCQGASPALLAARASPLLVALAFVAFVTSSGWQSGTDQPGRFARALVEQARQGCDATAARSISVPIVGVTWLCFDHAPPRIAGPVPNSHGRAWFSARAISVDDDFTAFRAEDVFVGSTPTASKFRLALRAKVATVQGLPVWGQTTALAATLRGAVVGSTVLLMGLLALFVVLRLALTSRALAGGCFGLAGLVSLRVLHGPAPGSDPVHAALAVLAVGLGVSAAPLVLVPLGRWLRVRVALHSQKSNQSTF